MSSKGFVVAEEGHVVSVYPPASGVGNGDVFSMRHYNHASIIITQGVAASATTITVERGDDFSPSNSTAITFRYYQEATSGGDTLGARGSGTSLSMTSGSKQIAVIEIDADQLTSSASTLYVKNSGGTKNNYSCVAILSGARFGAPESATEIA